MNNADECPEGPEQDAAGWSDADTYGEDYTWDDSVAPAAQRANDPTDTIGIVLMVALVLFAVAASIIMLFATSTGWMKIAVLAGLWAGVIGALLTTRYRRQLNAERGRVAELQRTHQVELEKELATHREQELILEQNYLDSLDSGRDETLAQLRAELTVLREHLSELLGQDLDEERVALRARAERLREIGIGSSATPLQDPEAYDRPAPRAQTHRSQATSNGIIGSHTSTGPVSPDKQRPEPVDVPEVGGGFNTDEFQAVPWPKPEAEAQPEPEPASHHRADDDEPQTETIATTTQRASVSKFAADPAPEPTAEQEPKAEPASAPKSEPTRKPATHGRRRAEDHSNGLTVAELLQQMRNKDS